MEEILSIQTLPCPEYLLPAGPPHLFSLLLYYPPSHFHYEVEPTGVDGMLLVLCKTSILGILDYNTILYIDRRENGGITINVALSHRGRNIYKCREEY